MKIPQCSRVSLKRGEIQVYYTVLAAGIVIFVLELIGGLFAHSLALVSDSGHVFIDNFSVIISIIVAVAVRRTSQSRLAERYRAYGTSANAVLLIVPGLLIAHEAFARLAGGTTVQTTLMIIVAIVGSLGNFYQHRAMHQAADKSHTTHRILHLHILSDLMQSLSVVLGGLLIALGGWQWIDPALSVAIGTLMLWWGLRFLCGQGRKSENGVCTCSLPEPIKVPVMNYLPRN